MRNNYPEPCTEEAERLGCTCTMRLSQIIRGEYAPVDPPEPKIARDCPLHGSERDPDDARDEQNDDLALTKFVMFGT